MGIEDQLDPNKEVVFDSAKGMVRFAGCNLSRDTIRAFFGLAQLGKMLRFGVEGNKTVVIQRVPEHIENLYEEIRKLLDKYNDKPADGFMEIERAIKFVESLGIKSKLDL